MPKIQMSEVWVKDILEAYEEYEKYVTEENE